MATSNPELSGHRMSGRYHLFGRVQVEPVDRDAEPNID
jgi:hypothetical protein